MKQNPQYSLLMKQLGVLLFSLFTALAAVAQTSPTLEATNTVVGGRRMSLQDCIAEALKHNFDVQINRYNPQIDLYRLRSDYGGYDPAFNLSGTHSFSVQPSQLDSSGLLVPQQTTKDDSFQSDIGGTLPWTGLQYDFSGQIDQKYGTTVGGTTNLFPQSFLNSQGDIQVTLTQPLLQGFLIDQNRLTIRLAKNTLKSSQQGFRGQIITSVTDVENAYYQLIYALENLKVQEEALNLSQTQLDQDKQRLQIGTLAQLSVQQDESQVAQNQANVIGAQSKLASDQDTLKNLITDKYTDWQNVDIQPSEALSAPMVLFNLEDSWSKAMTERPDLLQSRLSVEAQGIQLKFDVNQIFPVLDLTGSYGFNGSGRVYSDTLGQINQGNAPMYTYGAVFKVPLSNVSARNAYKSDKVTEKQLLLKLKQLEQTIMVTVDTDIKTAQSDYESVQATREARVYAEAALDSEQKTYSVGKATTFEVLTYQNNLTVARGNEIQALVNYEMDLAKLSSDEGSTLDNLGISIQTD
jgi:outer membrane protein